MSEFVFPHTRVDPRVLRLRLAAVGLSGFLLLGLLGGLLALQTLGVLSGDVRLTVRLPTVGDTLGINSDVKYHGLRVGRVVSVDPGVGGVDDTDRDGPGARRVPEAEVLVAAEHAELIPAGVRARVLPGTLFGNEYVDLVAAGRGEPATVKPVAGTGAATEHLRDGDVVEADTSRATLRLMDTFSATQRLLSSIDPAQWDLALSEMASALDGRGERIAEIIVDGDAFLGRWADLQPQVRRDLELLADNADLLADVEPQLVGALRDSRPLARTLVKQEEGTTALLTGVPRLLDGDDGVTAFLRANGDETARLLNATAANLEVFAERSPSFALVLRNVPELLRNGAAAVRNGRIQMEGVLGLQLLEPYDAEDCPRYRDRSGPCAGGRR
ncbi:MCE family protein [Nocardioides sp. SYSU DS0651]|uniref:MCE family protein n=1 Tax=Nocardioides sp. SYSU DS0651 TaxID=3415955 RepID=UPI003F4BBAC5